MAMTGWYPDPGGTPGRYRYWDGESWSESTTNDPADPPPGPGSRPPRRHHSPYGAGTALGVGALVLVVVVVASVLVIRRTGDVDGIGAGIPASTASSWDDSTPLASSGMSPRATPTSHPGPGHADERCTSADPDQLAPHSSDGRVHGGRLSMMPVPGYSAPGPEYMLSWMYDTQSVSQTTEPGWQSLFAVGEVARMTGFATMKEAVHTSMACAVTNGWYLHFSRRTDLRDERINVDGHPAWILTSEIRDDNPSITVAGDQLTFVAVDDGRTDAFSIWCGMVPLGDQQRIALDQRVLASLRVRG
jgi:hypothetical protein